jgi:hypothetical protein
MATKLNFYLSALDTNFNVSSATITAVNDGSDNKVNQIKAVAELYVDASSVRQVFKFATNSADLNDVSANDMYFFVDAEKFGKLPSTTAPFSVNAVAGTSSGELREVIGQAYVSGVKLTAVNHAADPVGALYSVDNKSLIKDLFRDLAHQLFKTQYGVDIFNNEQDLCNNTATSLKNLLVDPASLSPAGPANIWSVLRDASGMSVANSTAENVGRVIFDSIVFNDAKRLKDISGSTDIYVDVASMDVTANAGGLNTLMREYCMPLLAEDKLHFHIECKFDANQNLVVGDSALAISSRWYEIILNLQ